jgi:hypothetical protein
LTLEADVARQFWGWREISQSSQRNTERHACVGALFLGTFLGTIDDAAQSAAQSASKAAAIVGGRYGEWIPTGSWAIVETDGLRSACLVCDFKPYGRLVIALVAAKPSRKRTGIDNIYPPYRVTFAAV